MLSNNKNNVSLAAHYPTVKETEQAIDESTYTEVYNIIWSKEDEHIWNNVWIVTYDNITKAVKQELNDV